MDLTPKLTEEQKTMIRYLEGLMNHAQYVGRKLLGSAKNPTQLRDTQVLCSSMYNSINTLIVRTRNRR